MKQEPPLSDWPEIGRRHEPTYWVILVIILVIIVLTDQEAISPHRSFHNLAAAGAVAVIVTAVIGRIEVKLYKKARQEERQATDERWIEWVTNGQQGPPPAELPTANQGGSSSGAAAGGRAPKAPPKQSS